MRKLWVLIPLVGALLVAVATASASPPGQRNFRAHLAGREEVAPVVTNATGQAVFHLSKDGSELNYKLIVANIEDVFAAHIHCAPEGSIGPTGVTLFSGGPASPDGILSQATLAPPVPGNGCSWSGLGDVIEAMRSGNTYVNVHTLANPPGEIRGQIH